MPKSTLQNAADASPIKLKVRGQDGETISFMINRCSPIKKLLMSYCRERYYEFNTVRFLIEGSRFAHNKTPEQLGLEDGDQIDAMLQVSGGGQDVGICKENA